MTLTCECPPPLKEPGAAEWAENIRARDELNILIANTKWSRSDVGSTATTTKSEAASRWYFITYTQPETDKTPKRILKSAQRCVKSKAIAATQWAYSLELTEKGTPHVHIRLNTSKYPDYKKGIGAFNDGYRFEVQMERDDRGGANSYIVKDDTKPTPEWLEKHGLSTWFWCSEHYAGKRPDAIVNTTDPSAEGDG